MDEEEKKDQVEEVISEDNSEETLVEPQQEKTASEIDQAFEKEFSEESSKKGKKSKKNLTPEQKAKKTKKALIITAVVVLVLAVFFSSCAIANTVGVNSLYKYGDSFEKVQYDSQLVPLKDTDGYYTYTTDSELKILHLTDVHIGGGCFSKQKDEWAMNAVATMIRAEKPDLVVVTGDIAYPVPFQAGTFNNLNATKIFANFMENLGVYWTFVFGNHDTESYSMYTREDICEFYETSNFKYCLFQRGNCASEENGYGNTIIKVKNTAGVVTQALVMLDSHSYTDGDVMGILWKYDNIHNSQVDWYASEIDKINVANKAVDSACADVKSMAFFHIPLVEYRDAWKEYKEKGNNEHVQLVYGEVGEKDATKNGVRTYGVYCGCKEDDLYEVGLEKGLQAAFCGHDHYNHFSIIYTNDEGKSMRLTYGYSIDYLAYATIYHEHEQRGCTVIMLKPDGSYECQGNNYYTYYNVEHERD